jgi:hypothetical protein
VNVLLDQNNVFARDPRSYQIMEIMERWASDFVTIFQQDPKRSGTADHCYCGHFGKCVF